MTPHDQRRLAIALASLVASPVFAQFGGPGGMGGPPGRPPGNASECRNPPADSVAVQNPMQKLDSLRYQLRLTPEQEKRWGTYQRRIEAWIEDMSRPQDKAGAAPASAIGRIEARVDQARNRLTALEDIAEAARALYASLDARQKELADRLLADTIPTATGPMPGGPSGQPPRRE